MIKYGDSRTMYRIERNKLIISNGLCKEVILIYKRCPSFKLTEQFKILNLYLNLPVRGLIDSTYPRLIPPGSNYTTKYETYENPSDTCRYMTFKTLSPEDESQRLSRIVAPKNELLQLYQKNFNYKFSYKITNCSKCASSISFLYADFSQDDTSGASYASRGQRAYTLIDVDGNNIHTIIVERNTSGSFVINGWQPPILVKVIGDVRISLTVTGYDCGTFPPVNQYIIPIRTSFGVINLPVYVNTINSQNIISRVINDNFRGVNSILRGYHFSNPNFPCFGSTGNIISPPPYINQTISNMTKSRQLTPGDQFKITSYTGGIKTIEGEGGIIWRGIVYVFNSDSIMHPKDFILLDFLSMNINLTTSVFEVEVKTIINFIGFEVPTPPIIGSLTSSTKFDPVATCGPPDNNVPASWKGEPGGLRLKYTGTSKFRFDTLNNKSFSFIFGGTNVSKNAVILSDAVLEATFTYIGQGICSSIG